MTKFGGGITHYVHGKTISKVSNPNVGASANDLAAAAQSSLALATGACDAASTSSKKSITPPKRANSSGTNKAKKTTT